MEEGGLGFWYLKVDQRTGRRREEMGRDDDDWCLWSLQVFDDCGMIQEMLEMVMKRADER